MASPAKKGGWGSVFSNAVAGLESRLDTILADDGEASARARAAAAEEEAKRTALAPPTQPERDSSRVRANDRLAERLARATAAKSSPRSLSPSKSDVPSRSESPAVGESGNEKKSVDVLRGETDIWGTEEEPEETVEQPPTHEERTQTEEPNADVIASVSSLPARLSAESSQRPSVDLPRSDVSSRPSADLPNGTLHKSNEELQAELGQQREEMHIYLEKIDALQAKLTYLAQQTVTAAKEANASSSNGTMEEAQLAEKDERIALLMQEGEKLSKTELRHLHTIKKLRAKSSEDEKSTTETRKKLEKAEQVERDLKGKLRRAEVAERQASDKAKQITVIEKHVDELKVDRENAAELVRSLTMQLKESKETIERVRLESKDKGSEADKGRIAALENDLEDAQIERKLAETRAEADIKKVQEDLEGQKQRFSVRELELKNELSILESRVEAMRSRAEEASADGNVTGESSVKLLRQVETLQSQYALAKENWETIEGSLNARLVAMEKERDESNKREAEARKRAREVAVKARKAEEEVEATNESSRNMQSDVQRQSELVTSLNARLEQNEAALADTKAEHEKQKHAWESEMSQRLEEEKAKWQRDFSSNASHQQSGRLDSPLPHSRKPSHNIDLRRPTSRMASQELTALHIDQVRPVSRRSWNSSMLQQTNTANKISSHPSPPVLSREQSTLSLERNNSFPMPSIEVEEQPTAPEDAFEMTDTPAEVTESPDRTLADLVSISTSPAAGPSVQLVERMSTLIRRLESEKAATKDELARLMTQRDSARDEVVSLMREVETKRDAETRQKRVEGEMRVLEERYEASLEMLGEREEEVEELRADVRELKRLYRELVEEKMGGKA